MENTADQLLASYNAIRAENKNMLALIEKLEEQIGNNTPE